MKKKLQLNRTTLRNLTPNESAAAEGGAVVVLTATCLCSLFTCNVSCGGTCQNTCFVQVCHPTYVP